MSDWQGNEAWEEQSVFPIRGSKQEKTASKRMRHDLSDDEELEQAIQAFYMLMRQRPPLQKVAHTNPTLPSKTETKEPLIPLSTDASLNVQIKVRLFTGKCEVKRYHQDQVLSAIIRDLKLNSTCHLFSGQQELEISKSLLQNGIASRTLLHVRN